VSTRTGTPIGASAEAPAQGVRAQRGRPARYTQDDLLEVVAQVFNERGYEAASMADLARASGLTKSAFYHHVSGKEQLLRLAVNRALDALSAALDEEEHAAGRPVDLLERALRRTTEVLITERPYVTLLLRVRGNTEVERDTVARRRAVDARLAGLVKAAMDAREVRDDLDPRMVTRLLFGMVNSVSEWYRPHGTAPRTVDEDVVRAVVELAMDGLRARRS
jgi:AcrR family transcriptional regulator